MILILKIILVNIGINPLKTIQFVRGLPSFIITAWKFFKAKKNEKIIFFPILGEQFEKSGNLTKHYFYMDHLVAQQVINNAPKMHYDLGSRVDGFVSHIALHTIVEILDVRPININLDNIVSRVGIAEALPYENESISSFSMLHVFEHFGLGRYGDPFNLSAHISASKEVTRVMKQDGIFYFATPVTKEDTICFNAHRIFNPDTIINLFSEFELIKSICIDDNENIHHEDAVSKMKEQKYGCGIFIFRKISR